MWTYNKALDIKTTNMIYRLFSCCREEKVKHKKRMRKLENLYRHNLRRMRKTLEVKLERSATVLEGQRKEREKKISE